MTSSYRSRLVVPLRTAASTARPRQRPLLLLLASLFCGRGQDQGRHRRRVAKGCPLGRYLSTTDWYTDCWLLVSCFSLKGSWTVKVRGPCRPKVLLSVLQDPGNVPLRQRLLYIVRPATRTTTYKRMTGNTGDTMRGSLLVAVLVAVVVHLPLASAWYLPGSAPRSYKRADVVPFSVNALQPMPASRGNPYSQLPPPAGAGTGSNSAIKSIINIDYYHPKLHFCQPHGGPHSKAESLGSVLFGDRIYDSPIQAHLLKNESCVHVCTEAVPSEDMTFINDRITEQYAVNWMVDGLPVATKKIADRTKEICE